MTSLPANSTQYGNTGLTPLTEYCYKVRSFKKAGPNTSFAAFTNVSCNTTFGPPSAPSATFAYPRTSTSVEVHWTDNASTEQAFRIERSADSAGPWTIAGSVGPNNTVFTDNGRVAEQLVCYRVIATNTHGESAPSNVGCTTPPAPPASVTATSADASSIDVTWTDASNVEDGYSLERSLDGASFSPLADRPADATSYHDGSVVPDTRYWYRVRAKKAQGFSDYGQPWPYAAAASGAPQSPTLDRVVPAGSSAAYVVFSSSSVTATGSRIERSTDGQASWATAGTAGVSETFVDEGRVTEAEVCYRVFAFNAAGESAPSAVDCTIPPAAPTNLNIIYDENGSSTATWTDNSNVEERFDVWGIFCSYYYGYEYCDWDVRNVEANGTSITMGPNEYFHEIYAVYDDGYSDPGSWAGGEGVGVSAARAVHLVKGARAARPATKRIVARPPQKR